jgi:hypothetical protein
MSSRIEKRNRSLVLIIISLVVFGIGYYILDEVSTWFEIPLGNTFYVILGCSLMAISGVFVIYTIKETFFKKKKKRIKQVFLNDYSKEKKSR